jgi:predicted Zn-dependent protease
VTDSYYARKLGLPNTGHALPAPNPYGPMPLNLEMSAGDITEGEMVASIKRGVYVTRFHYVNVEDPMKVVLTGMTRDGTFLIENGELTRPVRNLRFTQGALEALSHVGAVGSKRALIGPGEGGATLVPALLLERWEFTGQTG